MKSSHWKAGRVLLVMFLSVLTIVGMVYLVQQLDLENTWVQLLQKVETYGWKGQLLFMAVVSACVVALIPSVLLTLGAGMLFGVVKGTLIIVVAETIGAYFAFLMGRNFLSSHSVRLLEKHKLMGAVFALPGRHDWRVVAFIRMLPFFPFKLSNYLFGLTPLTVASYFLGTFVGLWPITLFNVYLGSIATNFIALQVTGESNSPFQWFLYSLGLTFTAVVMIVAIRRAMREIERRTEPLNS